MPIKIYNRLRYYRERYGISQEQLAESSGIDKATISNIETGKTIRPYPKTRSILAEAMNVAVYRLFPPAED